MKSMLLSLLLSWLVLCGVCVNLMCSLLSLLVTPLSIGVGLG